MNFEIKGKFEKAVRTADYDTMNTLLQGGYNVNTYIAGQEGHALEIALKYNQLDVFKYLLTKGAVWSQNLLNQAVYSGNLDNVQYIYDNYDKGVDSCGSVWISTNLTTDTAKVVMMTKLLDLGANPDTYINDAVVLNMAVTKLLVARGANVMLVVNNMTTIEFALRRKMWHPLYYSLLPDKSNEMYVAIFEKNINRVNQLCTGGYNVNSSGKFPMLFPPLMVAIETSALDIADVLLSFGANPGYISPPNVFSFTVPSTTPATKGQTIVSMAVKSNDANTIRYVGVLSLEYPTVKLSNTYVDFWGETTPLRDAVANQNLTIVKTLLLFKANPNVPYTTDKLTIGFQIPYCKNALAMATLALKYGLDVNYSSPKYGTVKSFMMSRGLPDPATLVTAPTPSK